ncbi:MAG: tetratricopeptide repeat protein [Acidobacteriota bacterium]
MAATDAFFPAEVAHARARGEFRWVVTLFAGFAGDASDAKVSELVDRVFTLQERYGGYLAGIDFGDKGGNLLLYWGAPTGRENDVERAMGVALDLSDRSLLTVRAGITRFLMYAGFAGATDRATYSCYGRGVNLAARLMTAAAPGQIWVDETVVPSASRAFALAPVGRLAFKGFDDRRSVCRLRGRSERGSRLAYQGRTVGRSAELARLAAFMEPIRADARQSERRFAGAFVIYGEPGAGKSRLAHDFHQRFASEGTLYWAECPSDELAVRSMQPFRRYLREQLGQTATRTAAENLRSLDEALEEIDHALDVSGAPEAPVVRTELERTRFALAALLDLAPPGSPWPELAPELRFENAVLGIKALLCALSLLHPVVVFLDDIQWLDEDSRRTVAALTRGTERFRIAILGTSRLDDRAEKPRLSLPREVPSEDLDLAPLDGASVREIAEQVVAGPVDTAWVEFLSAKTGGNPFFAEQLALHLAEQGRLEVGAPPRGSLEELRDLPGTIEGVLVSRLDRLPVPVKHVVQTASVLGFEFDRLVLEHMLSHDPELDGRLREAAGAAIWSAVTELEYVFRHNLLRDAAYEMQLRSRLREQHRLAAAAYEVLFPVETERPYEKLAHHYGEGGVPDRWRDCLEKAADAARAAYANDAAMRDYGKLLDAAIDPARRVDLAVKLAGVCLLTGRLDRVEALMRDASAASASVADSGREAQALALLGQTIWRQGRHAEGLATCRSAAEVARRIEDWAQCAEALRNAGIVLDLLERHDEALATLDQALDAADRCGERIARAKVLSGLAVAAWNAGDRDRCLRCHQQALGLYRALGDLNGVAASLGNIGVVFRNRGDVGEARRCYAEAVEVFEKIGSRIGAARTLFNLGNIHRYLGEPEPAIPYFERAEARARDSGEKAMLCRIVYNHAVALADVGQVERSRALGAEADALATALEWDDFAIACRILAARLAAPADRAGAIAQIEKLRAMSADDWMTPLADHELWRLTGDESHRMLAIAWYRAAMERTGQIEYQWMHDRLRDLER